MPADQNERPGMRSIRLDLAPDVLGAKVEPADLDLQGAESALPDGASEVLEVDGQHVLDGEGREKWRKDLLGPRKQIDAGRESRQIVSRGEPVEEPGADQRRVGIEEPVAEGVKSRLRDRLPISPGRARGKHRRAASTSGEVAEPRGRLLAFAA